MSPDCDLENLQVKRSGPLLILKTKTVTISLAAHQWRELVRAILEVSRQ